MVRGSPPGRPQLQLVQSVGQGEALERSGSAIGVEWLLGEALVSLRIGRLGLPDDRQRDRPRAGARRGGPADTPRRARGLAQRDRHTLRRRTRALAIEALTNPSPLFTLSRALVRLERSTF